VQAERESNFRYTAAKMCSCLSEHMRCATGITFQSYLVNRFEASLIVLLCLRHRKCRRIHYVYRLSVSPDRSC